MPNGVCVPELPPPPPQDGLLKILFIGRLDPKKGIENLFQALSRIHVDWRLNVAGTGSANYTRTLHSVAPKRVQFMGHLEGDAKYRAFANSDLVVVPSHTENFGMTVAESLAHARPVIASTGTPWAKVSEIGCGLWISNDPESLAMGITQLASEDRQEMGLKGRQWMIDEFSWHRQAYRMRDAYASLLSGATVSNSAGVE